MCRNSLIVENNLITLSIAGNYVSRATYSSTKVASGGRMVRSAAPVSDVGNRWVSEPLCVSWTFWREGDVTQLVR